MTETTTAMPAKLADFPLPNYVRPGSVAYASHLVAASATTGPARELRDLADAIYAYAVRVGPRGDYVTGPIVAALLEAFVALLGTYDMGGWDGGTCDTWARAVARYITEPLD